LGTKTQQSDFLHGDGLMEDFNLKQLLSIVTLSLRTICLARNRAPLSAPLDAKGGLGTRLSIDIGIETRRSGTAGRLLSSAGGGGCAVGHGATPCDGLRPTDGKNLMKKRNR
jgi:hypothetical protein